LLGLKQKFTEILALEEMTLDDLTKASLTFIRAPEGRDDYSTICHAELMGRHGPLLDATVDFKGNTRVWPKQSSD